MRSAFQKWLARAALVLLGLVVATMPLLAGENEAAIRSLRRALQLHPYLRDARAELAQLLYDLERYEEAIPQLEALIDDPQGHDESDLTGKLQSARQRTGQQP